MSDTNAAILTEVAAAVAAVRGPWIVGGDWNLTPGALAKSGWPDIVHGSIQAPLSPTCNEHTYDYFVVSNDLSAAVAGVARIADGGCNPHWPARLFLHADARAKAVRRLIKPHKIPGKLPFGPLNKDVSCAQADENPQLRSWYTKARSVCHSLLASEPSAQEHRFRWEAATGRLACPNMGASNISAELRAIIRKVDHSIGLIEKGALPGDPRIKANALSNTKACASKRLDSPDVSKVAIIAWNTQVS